MPRGGLLCWCMSGLLRMFSLGSPPTCRLAGPSPFHTWFRLDAAAGLLRPLLIGAVYLPPFKSKYGLRSRQQLEDFFARLGDKVASTISQPPPPLFFFFWERAITLA